MSDSKEKETVEATGHERAFKCALRALQHLMHKNHELDPSGCLGCLEASLFLTQPGYRGDQDHPVGVDY